jgi:hypothetical protein
MKYRIVWMIDWRPYWPLSHDRTKSSFIQTGGAAAAQLLDEVRKVRAFVHREDERSEALRKRGAEVVVGDLPDFDTVRAQEAGRAYCAGG